MGQRVALYCRVSTSDQSCARQERDLTAFAERAGYEMVGTYKETASGVKLDRLMTRLGLEVNARKTQIAWLPEESSDTAARPGSSLEAAWRKWWRGCQS